MNSKRTQKYFIEVLKKPTSATMIALIVCLIGSHLTITVNAQFSRNDYRSGFLVTNPCVSKQTCSECLQTPTCAWCMKEVIDVQFNVTNPCNKSRYMEHISNILHFLFSGLYFNGWSTPSTL